MSDTRLVHCPSCGATNRVALAKHGPICGRCKTPLPIDAAPLVVTDASFAADVERAPLPVLMDAWAPWCGPCRILAPTIDQLSAEFAGRVRVAKLNVDENPRVAARFDLRSIPTLLVFRAGREVDRMVGVQTKAEIARRLEAWIAA